MKKNRKNNDTKDNKAKNDKLKENDFNLSPGIVNLYDELIRNKKTYKIKNLFEKFKYKKK